MRVAYKAGQPHFLNTNCLFSLVMSCTPSSKSSGHAPPCDDAEFDRQCELCLEAYSAQNPQSLFISLSFLLRHCSRPEFSPILRDREIPELAVQILGETATRDVIAAAENLRLQNCCLDLLHSMSAADCADYLREIDVIPALVDVFETFSSDGKAIVFDILRNMTDGQPPAPVVQLAIDVFEARDDQVLPSAMQFLAKVADFAESTLLFVLASIFPTIINDNYTAAAWTAALTGLYVLVARRPTLLEWHGEQMVNSVFVAMKSQNEEIREMALWCLPLFYEKLPVDCLGVIHRNLDLVTLCSFLRERNVGILRMALNVIGCIARFSGTDIAEGLASLGAFERCCELAEEAMFEIKIEIARIFDCLLRNSAKELVVYLIDSGVLHVMVDVIESGAGKLPREFFMTFSALLHKFPDLNMRIQGLLFEGSNEEALAKFESEDLETIEAHQAFLNLIQVDTAS
jgi:hypothetical protein